MCGICGYIGPKTVSREQVEEMNNTMYHRGPNDGGVWQLQNEHNQIGLAHRRLSIIDLSELGHQPMISSDERYTIVYNGEVYNFMDIRKELESFGYSFKLNCDTEVILYAYAKWEKECFKKFYGMFAIAIYDIRTNKLTLARDRIGKKPLYYYHNNGHFVFESELKPIMKYPCFEKKVDKNVIGQYLCNKYLAAPFCIFANTFKLVPGTIVEYCNDKLVKYIYWSIVQKFNYNSKKRTSKLENSIIKLDKLLQESVSTRLISDIPVGAFLSGGIDSTLVTAIAQKIISKKIKTYSIGFEDDKYNEAPFAAAIAKHIGTEHHEHYVNEKDIFDANAVKQLINKQENSDRGVYTSMLWRFYVFKDGTKCMLRICGKW